MREGGNFHCGVTGKRLKVISYNLIKIQLKSIRLRGVVLNIIKPRDNFTFTQLTNFVELRPS
jgi:hypothetical protein